MPRPYQPPRRQRPQAVPAWRARRTPAWLPLLALIPLAGAVVLAVELQSGSPRPAGGSAGTGPTSSVATAAAGTTGGVSALQPTAVAPRTVSPPVAAPPAPAASPAATAVAVSQPGTAPSARASGPSGLPTAAPSVGNSAPAATSGSSAAAGRGEPTSGAEPFFAYRVQPGDTVRFVASMYGVSAASVAQASGLTDPDRLRVGQILTVPRQSGWLYRVQAGESLDQVAASYGVSAALVEQANGLSSTGVSPGEVLLIPSGAPAVSK